VRQESSLLLLEIMQNRFVCYVVPELIPQYLVLLMQTHAKAAWPENMLQQQEIMGLNGVLYVLRVSIQLQ